MTSDLATNSNLTRPILLGIGASLSITSILLLAMLSPAYLGPAGSLAVMEAFSTLCHQIAERSPHLRGDQLAACHRCMGIYLGLIAGSLSMIGLLRYRRWLRTYTFAVIVVGAIPPAVDWLAGLLGIWNNTPTSRILTGLIFGLAAGICLARALVDTLEQRHARKHSAETGKVTPTS